MGVIRKVIELTPVLATAGAYTADYQFGAPMKLTNVAADTGGTVEIESVAVIDKAKQSAAFDLLFFDQEPTVISADNQECDIASSELLTKYKGFIGVQAFVNLKNNSVAIFPDTKLFLKAYPASKDLWCVAVIRTAKTYADGDIKFVIGAKQGAS